MLTAAEVAERLRTAFPGAEVQVRDLTGTGDHFEVKLISEIFAGKSLVEQHQLVYREVGPWGMQEGLQALALVTRTP